MEVEKLSKPWWENSSILQASPKEPIITKFGEAMAAEGYLSEEDEQPFSFFFSFQLKHYNGIYKLK